MIEGDFRTRQIIIANSWKFQKEWGQWRRTKREKLARIRGKYKRWERDFFRVMGEVRSLQKNLSR